MITVAPKQSLLDIALQHAGGAEAVFELAGTNTISITDDLGIGQQLVLCRTQYMPSHCHYQRHHQ